jgi:HEAT repeat protein
MRESFDVVVYLGSGSGDLRHPLISGNRHSPGTSDRVLRPHSSRSKAPYVTILFNHAGHRSPDRHARCLNHNMLRMRWVGLIALTCTPALAQPPALHVEIRCDAADLRVGDEIPITFIVTNVGGRSFDYGLSSSPNRFSALNFDLKAFDELQRPVMDPQSVGSPTGGIVGSILSTPAVLEPGDSFEETLPLNEWASLRQPGQFTVRGTYRAVGATFESDAVIVSIAPRSRSDMQRYVAALQDQWITASTKEERDLAVRRLAYTFDERALPTLLDALHGDASFAASQGIVHYSPITTQSVERILEDFSNRGLPPEGVFVLLGIGASEAQIVPIIHRSLQDDLRSSWPTAAFGATLYGDDRLMPRLFAIAEMDDEPARIHAIQAIANNRTDEGVTALKRLLDDPDPELHRHVIEAIRAAYARPRSPESLYMRPRGRRLLHTDFPNLLR